MKRRGAKKASARPVHLPRIQVNARQLRDVSADALAALVAANDPPQVFKQGNTLTRIRVDEKGRPSLEPLLW